MIKTNEFVKATGTTMFFPKIIVTRDEMERMVCNRQIFPNWLRLVVANYDEFKDLFARKQINGVKKSLYDNLVTEWSGRSDEVLADVEAFSRGEMDLLDMVVKYGVSYKQCRQFAKDVFTASDKTVDVDELWKQHKKHAQKNTTVALYGVEHTAMREEVQEKRRMTNRKVYGADNPMQNPEIKEKLRTRILAEHGVDYTFMKRTAIPTWLNKVYQCLMGDDVWNDILTNACKQAGEPCNPEMFLSVVPLNRRDFVISELQNTHVEDLLNMWKDKTGKPMKYPDNALFKLPFTFSKTWLRFYEQMGLLDVPELFYTSLSVYEKQMEYFLSSIGVNYVHNHKKALEGLEMDFYIPDKQIGIELNPNVSHNSNLFATEAKRSMFDSCKEPSYHYHKYRLAAKHGITLVQLFGNDLVPSTFEHITSKRLKSLLCGYGKRYFARNVNVSELITDADKKQARIFLDEHHSQGSSRAGCYWVFKTDGDIVGVASFTAFREAGAVELKRLCFMPDVQVIGGLSKLTAHYFRKHPECHTIFSYSDNSLGNGMSYEKAGAEFIKETGPALKFISPHDGRDTYSWQIATSWGANGGVIGTDAESKGIKKPATKDEINEYIETELTHRLDDLKGYDRIYTPGSKLWKFTRKE